MLIFRQSYYRNEKVGKMPANNEIRLSKNVDKLTDTELEHFVVDLRNELMERRSKLYGSMSQLYQDLAAGFIDKSDPAVRDFSQKCTDDEVWLETMQRAIDVVDQVEQIGDLTEQELSGLRQANGVNRLDDVTEDRYENKFVELEGHWLQAAKDAYTEYIRLEDGSGQYTPPTRQDIIREMAGYNNVTANDMGVYDDILANRAVIHRANDPATKIDAIIPRPYEARTPSKEKKRVSVGVGRKLGGLAASIAVFGNNMYNEWLDLAGISAEEPRPINNINIGPTGVARDNANTTPGSSETKSTAKSEKENLRDAFAEFGRAKTYYDKDSGQSLRTFLSSKFEAARVDIIMRSLVENYRIGKDSEYKLTGNDETDPNVVLSIIIAAHHGTTGEHKKRLRATANRVS